MLRQEGRLRGFLQNYGKEMEIRELCRNESWRRDLPIRTRAIMTETQEMISSCMNCYDNETQNSRDALLHLLNSKYSLRQTSNILHDCFFKILMSVHVII
jgi:hypothetical protein